MFYRSWIFVFWLSIFSGPLAWPGALINPAHSLKKALENATSPGRPRAEMKSTPDPQEKESSSAELVKKAVSDSPDSETVNTLLTKYPQIEKNLTAVLDRVKQGELPDETMLKDLSRSLGDPLGSNLNEAEVARFLINAFADQKNPGNDSFFKLVIDSAEKKSMTERNSVEKAVIAYADRLREKLGKASVEELAKKTGITEQQVALRLNKMNQFLEAKQSVEAAKIAADWLINLPPKSRSSLATSLPSSSSPGALGILKSGAELVGTPKDEKRLIASAASTWDAEAEAAFKTKWEDNVKYADQWAKDVKTLQTDELKKKYSPSETWLAQTAASGSDTAKEALKKVAQTTSEGAGIKIAPSNLSGRDSKPIQLKAESAEHLASLVARKTDSQSWQTLATPPENACDGGRCQAPPSIGGLAPQIASFLDAPKAKSTASVPPGLDHIVPKEGAEAVVCCSAANCGPCKALLSLAGLGDLTLGITRLNGSGGINVIVNKQSDYHTGNEWHPGSGFPSVRYYKYSEADGRWNQTGSSPADLLKALGK